MIIYRIAFSRGQWKQSQLDELCGVGGCVWHSGRKGNFVDFGGGVGVERTGFLTFSS